MERMHARIKKRHLARWSNEYAEWVAGFRATGNRDGIADAI